MNFLFAVDWLRLCKSQPMVFYEIKKNRDNGRLKWLESFFVPLFLDNVTEKILVILCKGNLRHINNIEKDTLDISTKKGLKNLSGVN